MAGKLQRAGASILRRATALGLVGLTVSLFVGVMAFALTTSSAGQSSESSTHNLATASRIANLTTVATARLQQIDTSGIIPRSVASAAELPPVDDAPSLLTASIDEAEGTSSLTINAARTVEAPTVEAQQLEPSDTSAPADAPETAGSVQPVATAQPPAATQPAPSLPDLQPGDRREATVSFYYCEQGNQGRHPGDGGLFCGHMRNGQIVYDGAAACEYKYLGQRFRIIGDPTERIYTCADTGNAVLGLHRDIWFHNSDDGWDWQRVVGQVAIIEIVE